MASDDDQESGTTRKTTTKKPAKKPATKRSTARKQPAERERASAPRSEASPRLTAGKAARAAVAELVDLTGYDVEGVTGIERSDDGWTVQVETVELRRIPSTTDVLAVYEVSVDSRGDLQGYRRLDRYSRGDTRSDDQ